MNRLQIQQDNIQTCKNLKIQKHERIPMCLRRQRRQIEKSKY